MQQLQKPPLRNTTLYTGYTCSGITLKRQTALWTLSADEEGGACVHIARQLRAECAPVASTHVPPLCRFKYGCALWWGSRGGGEQRHGLWMSGSPPQRHRGYRVVGLIAVLPSMAEGEGGRGGHDFVLLWKLQRVYRTGWCRRAPQTREYIDWRWPFPVCIQSWWYFSAHLAEGGVSCPPPFTLSTPYTMSPPPHPLTSKDSEK
jgi:hypothetical protein